MRGDGVVIRPFSEPGLEQEDEGKHKDPDEILPTSSER